ncbi:MAG: hypothetical protein ACI8QC_004491 [Planctomycetota bacterium]|jgi:hypothetical protein
MPTQKLLRSGLLALALLCTSATGQSITELSARPQVGGETSILLRSVTLVEGQPVRSDLDWRARQSEWLYLRGSGKQENQEQLPQPASGPVRWLVTPTPGDTWVAGVDLRPRTETVTPKEFAAFRVRQRASSTDRQDSAPGRPLRILRLESHKLLLRAKGETSTRMPGATALSKSGQRAELRPMADPSATPAGAALPLRLYLPEGYSKRQQVVATHLASGAQLSIESDSQGIATFLLDRAGSWSVAVHAIRPRPADARVDWEVCSATLHFQSPQGPAPKKHADDKAGESR